MVKLTKTQTEFELSPTLAANEQVMKKRAAGEEVLHMGFGESPFPVPERLREALKINVQHRQYLPTAGLPALCEAAADYYRDKVGLDTDRFDVIIAPGSKLNIYALQMAVAGDLLMPVPSWVSYKPQAHMLDTAVIDVPTVLDEAGFHIDPDVLRQTIHDARARGQHPAKIILNYPSNPTGLSIPEEELEALAQVCIDEDIFIISDEIYGFVTADCVYRTIAKYAPTHTAITTGLSKHLSLGGWRIGVAFIPKGVEGLRARMCNIASELWSCVPAPLQFAAIEAYQGHADIEAHIRACTEIHVHMNRYISAALQKLGVKAPTPQGAFYNYPDFEAHRAALNAAGIHTSQDLARVLLDQHNLAALPAVAFGAPPDVLALRISGCDYDGTAVLAAYYSYQEQGKPLDEAFIQQHAPRIVKATQAFATFLGDVK